jgi:hypothetical protein
MRGLHPPFPMQQPIRELSLLSVQEMIVAEGFLLVRSRLMHLSRERAQQFYAEHRLQKSVPDPIRQKFQRYINMFLADILRTLSDPPDFFYF